MYIYIYTHKSHTFVLIINDTYIYNTNPKCIRVLIINDIYIYTTKAHSVSAIYYAESPYTFIYGYVHD